MEYNSILDCCKFLRIYVARFVSFLTVNKLLQKFGVKFVLKCFFIIINMHIYVYTFIFCRKGIFERGILPGTIRPSHVIWEHCLGSYSPAGFFNSKKPMFWFVLEWSDEQIIQMFAESSDSEPYTLIVIQMRIGYQMTSTMRPCGWIRFLK